MLRNGFNVQFGIDQYKNRFLTRNIERNAVGFMAVTKSGHNWVLCG